MQPNTGGPCNKIVAPQFASLTALDLVRFITVDRDPNSFDLVRNLGELKRYPTEIVDQMKAPLSIAGVVVIATLHIVLYPVMRELSLHSPHLQSDSLLLTAAAIGLLPSLIFAYALPKIRVGPMSKHWFVPQQTFVLSRPLLCLLSTSMTGAAIGTITTGLMMGWGTVAQGFVLFACAIVFLYSANERCQRPASTEFSMVFWRSLFRFNLY